MNKERKYQIIIGILIILLLAMFVWIFSTQYLIVPNKQPYREVIKNLQRRF